jgi:hypothetical protein
MFFYLYYLLQILILIYLKDHWLTVIKTGHPTYYLLKKSVISRVIKIVANKTIGQQ